MTGESCSSVRRLAESQANMPVRVGDLLLVEEVDAAAQRVVVSVCLRSICFNNYFIEELVMYLVYVGLALLAVFALLPIIVNAFLRDVEAGEIRLVSWMGGKLKIYRGPCKSTLIPMLTVSKVIPAQAINIDIEITDQTADMDAGGRPAPVKVTVKASAIVSVGETDGMVNTAANKFFSKPKDQQLSTLTDVLSSAGRRAINLLKHDQLFNARSGAAAASAAAASPRQNGPGGPQRR